MTVNCCYTLKSKTIINNKYLINCFNALTWLQPVVFFFNGGLRHHSADRPHYHFHIIFFFFLPNNILLIKHNKMSYIFIISTFFISTHPHPILISGHLLVKYLLIKETFFCFFGLLLVKVSWTFRSTGVHFHFVCSCIMTQIKTDTN